MKIQYAVGLSVSMLIGIGIGAAAVQSLHAQAKPPAYLITEIDVSNLDAYLKDYSPLAQKTIKDAGGRLIAAGQGQSVEGDPPKARVTIIMWDSAEKMQAWRTSAAYKSAREIGDKLAKFRAYLINGVSQ
jgi:uncharacterized protein (DUF1330 family)